MDRRQFLLMGLSASLTTVLPAGALGQQYPSGQIRIVVPFPAGGTTDIVGRYVAQGYTDILGVPAFVDNVGGGRGNLGVSAVAKARPDGYTLLLASASTLSLNPSMSKSVPFDPIKDFASVGLFASSFGVLVVTPSFPARSVKELVAMAKAQPGKINYASSGAGSAPHLLMEMLKVKAGIDLVHIPYKGTGPALIDVLSGQGGSVMMPNIPVVREHISAGTLRAIAVNAKQRSPLLPDVPTLAEEGYGGSEHAEWFGLLAPAGTAPAIIEMLNRATRDVLAKPEMQKKLTELGLVAEPGAPSELSDRIASELKIYSQVIRDLGIQPE